MIKATKNVEENITLVMPIKEAQAMSRFLSNLSMLSEEAWWGFPAYRALEDALRVEVKKKWYQL